MKLVIKDHKDLNEFLGVEITEGTYYFHVPGLCLINQVQEVSTLFCGDKKVNHSFFIKLEHGYVFVEDGFIFERTNMEEACIDWSFRIKDYDGNYMGHITKGKK